MLENLEQGGKAVVENQVIRMADTGECNEQYTRLCYGSAKFHYNFVECPALSFPRSQSPAEHERKLGSSNGLVILIGYRTWEDRDPRLPFWLWKESGTGILGDVEDDESWQTLCRIIVVG